MGVILGISFALGQDVESEMGKGGIKHEKISYKQYYYQYFFYC